MGAIRWRSGPKWKLVVVLAVIAFAACWRAQEAVIAPAENLVVDGVPAIPASLVGNRRAIWLVSKSDSGRLASDAARNADRYAIWGYSAASLVKMPGGERQQLTFFADAVGNGRFHPNGGDYIVFAKDIGGGEWYQLYRYDVASGNVTLLTDGKSRNLRGPWSSGGDQIAYMSTRRTGKDTDLWVMNPADPKKDRLLTQLREAGGSRRIGRRTTRRFADRGDLHQRVLSVARGYRNRRKDGADAAGYQGERSSTEKRNSARTEKAFTSPPTRTRNFSGWLIWIWPRSSPNI